MLGSVENGTPRSVRRLHGHRPLIPTVERRSGSGHLSPAQGVRPSGWRSSAAVRRGVPKLLRERCGQGFHFPGRLFPQVSRGKCPRAEGPRAEWPGSAGLSCSGRVFPQVSRSSALMAPAAWRPRASRQKGGTRWTLIVRAEVGPSRCCLRFVPAHARPQRHYPADLI